MVHESAECPRVDVGVLIGCFFKNLLRCEIGLKVEMVFVELFEIRLDVEEFSVVKMRGEGGKRSNTLDEIEVEIRDNLRFRKNIVFRSTTHIR